MHILTNHQMALSPRPLPSSSWHGNLLFPPRRQVGRKSQLIGAQLLKLVWKDKIVNVLGPLYIFSFSVCHTHTHAEFRHLVDSVRDLRGCVCASQNIWSTGEKEICTHTHTQPHHYHQPTQWGVSGLLKDVDHVIISRNRDSTPKSGMKVACFPCVCPLRLNLFWILF